MSSVLLIAVFAFGYGLGSIPFGILLTKAAGIEDLRSIGSGNIGATNVLRTGRKDLAAATLLLDGLKGTLAVIAGLHFSSDAGLAAALGAFLGHVYPVWLKFRGGKGVATFLGCLAGFYWPAGIVFALVWLGVAWFTRYSSAAALAAALAAPAFLLAIQNVDAALVFACLAGLLIYKHRENISRLIAGSESKIGKSE